MKTTSKVLGELAGERVIEVTATLEKSAEKKFFSMAYYLLDYRKYKVATIEKSPNVIVVRGRESEVMRFLNDILKKIKELVEAEKR